MLQSYSLKKSNIRGTAVTEIIDTKVGTGASNYLTFSSIPQTFRDLRIRLFGAGTGSGGFNSVVLTLNGVSTPANYYYERLVGFNTTVVAQENPGTPAGNVFIGAATSVTTGPGMYASFDILIPEYTSVALYKNVISTTASLSSLASGGLATDLCTGSVLVGAVTSIELGLGTGGNWTTLSRAILYGIPA